MQRNIFFFPNLLLAWKTFLVLKDTTLYTQCALFVCRWMQDGSLLVLFFECSWMCCALCFVDRWFVYFIVEFKVFGNAGYNQKKFIIAICCLQFMEEMHLWWWSSQDIKRWWNTKTTLEQWKTKHMFFVVIKHSFVLMRIMFITRYFVVLILKIARFSLI